MASIKFLIKTNSETSTIYLRFKQNPIDLTAKTNFIINAKDWSNKKGQPISTKSAELKQLDKDLKQMSIDLINYYNRSIGNKTMNIQWLRDFINPPKEDSKIPNRLVDYFDFYMIHKKNELSKASFKKLNVIKGLLSRFEAVNNRIYLISDIDIDFKLKLENYCKSEEYAPNTIARIITFIKTICFHARNNGIQTHFQLDSITAKYYKVEKIYLNNDELKMIENVKLENENYLNARDWLLISCETGQRVSDFLKFNKEMIRYQNSKPLIEFTQVKTGKIMTVPLSKKVIAILNKRKGNFPNTMSDQKYNEYIKEVCKLAKLTNKIKGSIIVTDKKTGIKRKKTGIFEKWQLVSSHIGRRSFATNNYGRIPTSLLIGATGHSTEKLFLEYIGKSDEQKALQLAEYF